MGLIRFMLAIAVFNSHFPMLDVSIVDGHEAVLTFFAISGFYMALILDSRYGGKRQFYLSRFLSLYPMYVFALILSVALTVTFDIHPMSSRDAIQEFMADPTAFLVMMWTSICVFGQELQFSLGQSVDGGLHFIEASRHGIWRHAPLIQAWSPSLELVFYAMAPLLVKLKTRTLITLVAASLALKLGIMCSDWAEIVFFKRFYPLEFWLFGCGILAYRAYKLLPSKPRAYDYVAFGALLFTVITADVVPDFAEPFTLPAAALISMPFIFRTFGRFSFDKTLGKLSYPFYLLHFTVIAIFETCYEEPEGWTILLTTTAGAIIMHAFFTPGTEALKRRLAPVVPAQVEVARQPIV